MPELSGLAGFNSGTFGAVCWTAPTAMTVTVEAKFWGMDYNNEEPTNHWTTAAAKIFKNYAAGATTALWSSNINGFAGRAVNGYADSLGTCPVATYSNTITVAAGDMLEFAAAGRYANESIREHVGLQLKIWDSVPTGLVSGYVRSDAAGNPPIAGARVQDSFGTYVTYTGTDGYWAVANVIAGTYTFIASKAMFDSQQLANVSVPSNNVNFILPAWGTISGVVTGNGANLTGARVVVTGRSESGTTDSSGQYSITIPAGTYTLTCSKAGYEPVVNSNVVLGSQGALLTRNFDLPLGVLISGTVTDNTISSHPTIAGATVGTSDGVYAATSNSAGAYSLRVTRAAYNVAFNKSGYIGKMLAADASAGGITVNAALDEGWDFASDFATTLNPNGPWAYGYAAGSVYSQSPDIYARMPYNSHWSGTSNDLLWYGFASPGYNGPTFFKNALLTPMEGDTAYYGLRSYREARKVVANPSTVKNTFAVARFIAPSSGYYQVQGRFAGASPYYTYPGPNFFNGTTAKVGLIHEGSLLLPMSQIKGFAGRSENGYTDSVGTAGTPVYTYADTIDVSKGDIIDAFVLNDQTWPGDGWGYNGPGWTQVDLTITAGNTVLMGHVTTSLPGNGPIPGARVILNGHSNPWPMYETNTDANGNYTLSVRPDTYSIEIRQGYSISPAGLQVVIPASVTTTYNYQLTHSGTWSLADDYSGLANPDGQWSYGSVYTSMPGGVAPVWQFAPYASFGPTAGGLSGWNGYVPFRPTGNDWLGWIAKNTTDSPATWADSHGDVYVEPNHLCFLGGDVWYNGGPAVRWTSPDRRVVSVDLTIASQRTSGGERCMTLFRNLTKMGEKVTDGFVGRFSAGYSDRVGPAPTATWSTVLLTNAGDTLEFALGRAESSIWTHWIPMFPSYDVSLTIGTATGVEIADSIQAIKGLASGTTVIMTTPVQLCCSTNGPNSFARSYSGSTQYSFYVQNDDRTQGIKCITDGTVPTYDSTYKVTFTGVIDTESGQKVLRVQSINSASLAAAPKLFGKGSKALTNTATLVKVWGKITQMVPNTNMDPSEFDGSGNRRWNYEYIMINDGGMDIKIPTHTQINAMSTGDPGFAGLSIGDFIAVSGIATTTNGTDAVVMPRIVFDIHEYSILP